MLVARIAGCWAMVAALTLSATRVVDAFTVIGRPTAAAATNVVGVVSLSRPTPLYATGKEQVAKDEQEEAPQNEQEQQPEPNEVPPVPQAKANDSSPNDILNSPEFLERKLEVIKSDIAKVEADMEAAKQRLEAGRREWGPQFDDLRKEYETIQDRMKVQSQKGDGMAIVQVARKMLNVLDNFDRALGFVKPQNEHEEAIAAAYYDVYQQILSTFEKLGIEQVATVGTEFDYEIHQAVMQRPGTEYEEGVVCEELQKGYKIGDTLVRAAMVSVAV